MMVLLPEGRAINNPDTIKMVKIMPSTCVKAAFVVAESSDDDSELMI